MTMSENTHPESPEVADGPASADPAQWTDFGDITFMINWGSEKEARGNQWNLESSKKERRTSTPRTVLDMAEM